MCVLCISHVWTQTCHLPTCLRSSSKSLLPRPYTGFPQSSRREAFVAVHEAMISRTIASPISWGVIPIVLMLAPFKAHTSGNSPMRDCLVYNWSQYRIGASPIPSFCLSLLKIGVSALKNIGNCAHALAHAQCELNSFLLYSSLNVCSTVSLMDRTMMIR